MLPLLFSYSDASNVACGAFVVGTNEVSHRMWTACEAAKSSTWRELKAIQFALSAFKASVRGKCVKWHSDSQGAVRVVEIGSPSAELHSIALDIFYFCRILHSFPSGFPGNFMLVLMRSATL